jgi:hypothetical protein
MSAVRMPTFAKPSHAATKKKKKKKKNENSSNEIAKRNSATASVVSVLTNVLRSILHKQGNRVAGLQAELQCEATETIRVILHVAVRVRELLVDKVHHRTMTADTIVHRIPIICHRRYVVRWVFRSHKSSKIVREGSKIEPIYRQLEQKNPSQVGIPSVSILRRAQ